jgi:hypothetical protein
LRLRFGSTLYISQKFKTYFARRLIFLCPKLRRKNAERAARQRKKHRTRYKVAS